jgi:hypothetical protein
MDIFCKLGFFEVICPKAKVDASEVDASVKTTLIIHPTSKKSPNYFGLLLTIMHI